MNYFKESNWIKKTEYGGEPKAVKIVLHSLFWGFLLITLVSQFPLQTVRAGERGVLLSFGAVTGKVHGEGLYFRIPFKERIVKMDVRTQKIEVAASAASKDLQEVRSVVALNYHLDPGRVSQVYQRIGIEYSDTILAPAIQEAVKAATAQFTAEELIIKRGEVRLKIRELLMDKVGGEGIVIDEFSIVDLDFSEAFNKAIEKKVTAEQDALAAKNKLSQIKFEAEQRVATARGKADAMDLEGEALRRNPGLVELIMAQGWDGVVPTTWMCSGSPLSVIIDR